jgi:ABC-type transporter Mla subunit MlaD
MRHNRFYTLVGIFVVGALSLIIAGSVFFYKQYLQAKIETYVMFFKGSLKGLDATTPVTYRGVKIGEVRLIEITENKKGNNVVIPVYVEFFVEKTLGFSKNPVRLLIINGYVADISKPNFLTGVADIELVKNKTPPVAFKQTYFRGYPIFPTRNSVEKFTTIDEALKKANAMFEDISRLVRSPEIQRTLSSTKAMADSLDKLANNLDEYAPSVVAYLNQSLKKIANAAESTQNLTDYLARYPESLLRGKK